MNNKNTPVGFDLGNTATKIYIDSKVAKIPSRVAFERPSGQISGKTGQELKAKAFPLLFTQGDKTVKRWFGQDVLGVGSVQKLDMAKYDPGHITVLFRAALYQWGRIHRVDLASLGKLNIVASMPPGLFKDQQKNRLALAAFRKAFNRGQSHLKIRDEKTSVQIVTHFQGLVREAVAFGQDVPRQGEFVLIVDIGGFTNDFALYNGSAEPLRTWTDNNGLLAAYTDIDPLNPAQAELKILRTKKSGLPHQLTTFYNEVERRVQIIALRLPNPITKLYVIGGGSALMTPAIKATFTPLADKVIFKNEYANSEANWRKAGGK
jgi:hypothetical protein